MTEKLISILAFIYKDNEILIKENRYYISVVTKILLFMASQNITLRGNHLSNKIINKGNSLKL